MNIACIAWRVRVLLGVIGLALAALPIYQVAAIEFGTMNVNSTTICSNTAIPLGWVATHVAQSSSCHGYFQLQITQTTAADVNLTICNISPKLTGNWIYTGISPLHNSAVCTSSFAEMRVHKVQAADTSSNYCNYPRSLPAGWAVNRVIAGTGGTCAQYQTMNVVKLSGSGSASICDIGVAIAAPWVATQVLPGQTNGICKNFQQVTVRAAVANGVPMQTCSMTSLRPPPGFVISGMSVGQPSGPCANYVPQSIMSVGNLPIGTSIKVCSISPVPTGWIVTSNNAWISGGQCASYATNTIRRIS